MRVSFRDGALGRSAYQDNYCLLCGTNMTLLAEGRTATWEDLDDAGRSLRKEEDRRQRSLAVAQADRRERMSNTTARTFECTSGTSNKFWKVWRAGKIQMVLFGPIGATGQARQKEHRTIAGANRSIADLIRKKLAKGYVEVTQRFPNGASTYGDQDEDRGAAARKAWVTRRKNEAAAKLEAAKPKNPHGLPPGFLGPRRVPKVK